MDLHWFFRRRFSNAPDFSDDQNLGTNPRDEMLKSSNFNKSFDNIDDASKGVFRHMDEMLNQMFSSTFIPFGNGSIGCEDNFNKETDPRSEMLKDLEFEHYSGPGDFFASSPGSFMDDDIDAEVAKHGLILDQARPDCKSATSFSQKFSSSTMIKLPDGTLEERRKVTDHLGNVTTTIRRSIGNQSYEVTTHSNEKGIKETEEILKNLDENDLPDFEKQWQILKEKPNLKIPDSGSLVPSITPPIGDTSYLTIFKKFFGF